MIYFIDACDVGSFYGKFGAIYLKAVDRTATPSNCWNSLECLVPRCANPNAVVDPERGSGREVLWYGDKRSSPKGVGQSAAKP
jgi:hypothetical protein